jgi:hypothetical protein
MDIYIYTDKNFLWAGRLRMILKNILNWARILFANDYHLRKRTKREQTFHKTVTKL